jgi:YHS domain-containing protein
MRALRFLNLVGVLATLFMTAGAAVAGKNASQAKPQSTCPVTGKPIDKGVSTIYGGQKVYFCCPKCIATFDKDPETNLAKLGEQGQVVESQQKFCPVSGDPIEAKVSVDYKGRHVFFCCAMCIKDFQADPAKYLPLLGRAKAPADAGMHRDEAAPNNEEHKVPGHGGVTRTSTDGS